jgi:phosphoglycolate phosphatase-like HAD superfamily hydrolase
VLREEVVQRVIDGVLVEFTPQSLQANTEAARAELQRIERGIGRLTDAIAAGDELTPLLEALRQRQAHRAHLATVVGASNVAAVSRLDRRAIEAKVRERVHEWRQLLTTNIEDGRQLLREVLAGPLRFTPEGRSYRFEGEATLG